MDTIGDFITRLRNASLAGHEKVDIPSSNMRQGIATKLKESGYVRHFKVVKDGKQGMMRVYLKYDKAGEPLLSNIRRYSRPGRRFYVGSDKIPVVRSGYGMAILSTNKGLLSGTEAKEQNVGGEVLVTVW